MLSRYLKEINYLSPEDDESSESEAPFDQTFADSEQLMAAANASNSRCPKLTASSPVLSWQLNDAVVQA